MRSWTMGILFLLCLNGCARAENADSKKENGELGVQYAVKEYGILQCSGENFELYDRAYNYAYSHVFCADKAGNRKVFALSQRDLRSNKSRLVNFFNKQEDFILLGIDNNNNIYWVSHDGNYLNKKSGVVNISKTSITNFETTSFEFDFNIGVKYLYLKGYFAGGYVLQVVSSDNLIYLYKIDNSGIIKLIYAQNSDHSFVRNLGVHVPDNFYSPIVIYDYSGDAEPYALEGMTLIGNDNAKDVKYIPREKDKIILSSFSFPASFSKDSKKFVMGGETYVGHDEYQSAMTLHDKNFEDNSLDKVIIYDEDLSDHIFQVNGPKPYYDGDVGISPNGNLFYARAADTVSVNSIKSGDVVFSEKILNAHVKFIDDQTVLINHSNYTKIITLKP